jgi:hypothetical protein
MTAAFLALLPVFSVIVAGLLLCRSGLIPSEQWFGIDRLCYFVLFPAFFFKEIAAADFSSLPVLSIAMSMALAILCMAALLLLAARPLNAALGTDGAQFTSVFQGATRWHTFIAFALVPVYFGSHLVALAALAAAVMTPVLNIICVAVIARFARKSPASLGETASALIRNPFLLSSLAGLLCNISGLTLPTPLFHMLDIVAKGALGLALLSVGAGLRIETLSTNARAIGTATALKLFGMPALVWIMLRALGVEGEPAAVAILCNAVPTGSGAYVLARQMGGDAPLIANILTFQVICAALAIPFVVTLST